MHHCRESVYAYRSFLFQSKTMQTIYTMKRRRGRRMPYSQSRGSRFLDGSPESSSSARQHTRPRLNFSVFALLCFCCLESVSCYSHVSPRNELSNLKQGNALVSTSRKNAIRGERRLSPGGRRGLQQDNDNNKKNDDKNKNNKTPPPSPPPTMQPTTRQPTIEPTYYPTYYPTAEPTSSPTASPTVEPLNAPFSVQFSLSRPDGSLTAEQVEQGNEANLTQSVFNALLNVLCLEKDTVVVAEQDNKNGPNVCFQTRSIPRQSEDRQGKTILLTNQEESYTVRNEQSGDVTWVNWDVSYIALQVGDKYLDEMEEVEAGGPTSSHGSSAVALMEKSVQETLNNDIEEGSFLANMEEIQVSVVGNEMVTFTDDDYYYDDDDDELEPIDPDFWHATRIAGFALLIFCVVSLCILTRLSARRKKKKAREALSDSDPQFLHTEEGLHDMLIQSRFNKGGSGEGSNQAIAKDEDTLTTTPVSSSDDSSPKQEKSLPETTATTTAPTEAKRPEPPSSLTSSIMDPSSWGFSSLLGPMHDDDDDDTGSIIPMDCGGSSMQSILPDWMALSAAEQKKE